MRLLFYCGLLGAFPLGIGIGLGMPESGGVPLKGLGHYLSELPKVALAGNALSLIYESARCVYPRAKHHEK